MKITTVVFLFFFVGWIMNIIQSAMMLPDKLGDMAPMLIFKIVGIFVAPLGGILGWIGVFV